MPRIAVALGVLGAVAFCIGFNTVRYPVVWEMLQQPGLPVAASQPADAPSPAALVTKPPQPAAKSTPSTGSASKTTADAGKRAPPAANQAESQPEFCTADGVCRIAAGPRPTTQKGPSPRQGSSDSASAAAPALPRDASLDGLKDRRPEAGDRRPEAAAAKETPLGAAKASDPRSPAFSLQPPACGLQPPDSRLATAARVARVERPLVPVPDGPTASPLRPLPPVDELAAAASGPAVPQPAGASTPFYPTTGYPAVDLARFQSGKPGNLVPVSQPGS